MGLRGSPQKSPRPVLLGPRSCGGAELWRQPPPTEASGWAAGPAGKLGRTFPAREAACAKACRTGAFQEASRFRPGGSSGAALERAGAEGGGGDGDEGTRGQREGPARGVGGLLVPPRLNSRRTMAQCRDLENHHHEKLLEAAINTLEKTVKGELDEDLPDDVRAVSAGARGGRRHSAVRSTAGVSGPAPQGGALRPRVSCAEVQQQVCHALGRAPLSFLRH